MAVGGFVGVFGGSGTALGAALAVLAALGFAGQYLCIRIGTDDGTVTDAVLITLLTNVVLLVPAVVVLYWGELGTLYTAEAAAAFVGAGLVGAFGARIAMYRGIQSIGASRTAPVVASNALFATGFATVFLDERVTAAHLLGILLVVVGVAALSWETAEADATITSRRALIAGIAYPILAALLIGIEPIFLSIGLADGTPAIPGLALMVTAGFVGFLSYWVVCGSPTSIRFGDSTVWWYVAAGVASTVGFVGYLLGLEASTVVVVVPIMQTNPLMVLVLSALFLPARLEAVTWKLLGSACVIVVGATVVALAG